MQDELLKATVSKSRLKRREFLKQTALSGSAAITTIPGRSRRVFGSPSRVRVLCWSELTEPKEIYPRGISGAIADFLYVVPGVTVQTASIEDPGQGIPSEVLDKTDVLIWWGHQKHKEILFDRVADVVARVQAGQLGFIGLHSSHYSKVFRSVLECSGELGGWRHSAGTEHLKVVAPSHPIAQGISDFSIPATEMYNEPFRVPPPEKIIFFGCWETGEQFRSGCSWTVGQGRVFYFRPGHETYPVFHQKEPLKIMANAVKWCAVQA